VGASATYTPPIPFSPADFNRSRQKDFPRVQRSAAVSNRPYANTKPRTAESAEAYVDLGQPDDTGAVGPDNTPKGMDGFSDRDRLPLMDIASASEALSESVTNATIRTELTALRSAAVGLHTLSLQRPLTDEENSRWLDLSTALSHYASDVAHAHASTAPGSAATIVSPPSYTPMSGQQMLAVIDQFEQKNGDCDRLESDKRITVSVIEKSILTPLKIPKIRPMFDRGKWIRANVFRHIMNTVKSASSLTDRYNRVRKVLKAFKDAGYVP